MPSSNNSTGYYKIEFHPEFFSDIKKLKLTKDDLERVYKKVKEIQQHPTRFKHLGGGENCYRVRFGGLRLTYYLEEKIIWFLIIDKRSKVYRNYLKRLYNLKRKLL